MKSVKERAQKRERAAAKELGGRAVTGSGSLWYDKGDIKTDRFLIEDKFTDADTYTIKLSVLNTVEKQASKVHKVPFLRFGFEKFQTNYIMFHVGYYNEVLDPHDPLAYRIETSYKSLMVTNGYLEKLELSTESEILCYIIINDEGVEKPFAVMTWSNFKKNQDKFIA